MAAVSARAAVDVSAARFDGTGTKRRHGCACTIVHSPQPLRAMFLPDMAWQVGGTRCRESPAPPFSTLYLPASRSRPRVWSPAWAFGLLAAGSASSSSRRRLARQRRAARGLICALLERSSSAGLQRCMASGTETRCAADRPSFGHARRVGESGRGSGCRRPRSRMLAGAGRWRASVQAAGVDHRLRGARFAAQESPAGWTFIGRAALLIRTHAALRELFQCHSTMLTVAS